MNTNRQFFQRQYFVARILLEDKMGGNSRAYTTTQSQAQLSHSFDRKQRVFPSQNLLAWKTLAQKRGFFLMCVYPNKLYIKEFYIRIIGYRAHKTA